MIRRFQFQTPIKTLPSLHHRLTTTTAAAVSPPPTTTPTPPPPVNPSHLLRVSTILYQQQHSPESRLQTSLSHCNFHLTHEFFLQICNKFPYSWKPIYKFHIFSQTQHFNHNPTTLNKMLDIIGKSKNIDLLWDFVQETGNRTLVTDKTYIIVVKTLASARELKKCVDFFHVMNGFGYGYDLGTLNKVVESLCGCKLVEEAKYIVQKLKGVVKPDGFTYKCLICGFCDVGDLVEGSKMWNLMVDEGFVVGIDVVEKMMDTLFKTNRFDEAMRLFQSVRVDRVDELGLSSYRLVIKWMCKKDKLSQARVVFDEMRERGIEPDCMTLGSLIYGFLSKARVREAYEIAEAIDNPDISVYHGLIKGLLRLKKANEATNVFREMIRRGCEPTMHTYVMLLQGHLGKRGRKGDDPLINFDTIFVGGLVKAGKSLEATKYIERVMNRGLEVPRFDYNRFLHYYSNEEGVVMFDVMSKKLREVGLFDLGDIFERYGQKMATRDKRRDR
ncbi:putative tetratricopeptide-like helical domain superfamily [Helianthus annuus]|uniref:Putative pentatricopeptide repeat (PPR) superfamily protein n=1 Tax=Helianthus annuus TaxID=4232 RepID=A0A251T391_HELAN|nr:putative pentatricopeptide repeat-containing protein At1g26500 [Helianthus annuus]KAF5778674.1 putative tetratricopeptide-like helical domain superfamily [Helianthus annuus]KAJ0490036.1 putative tetratricopeptide-like helical domain superfamily [Helianthus annuus]KAJ0494108.1 putative tetratricopeptide-like helical domain superfamily [Helianthus annuus]KAJ0675621.1 putative tetratricopeptide-like helical domain superfamily [Helianthus annuus]KAJ0678899.1 putative tetratricopeptide-like heli